MIEKLQFITHENENYSHLSGIEATLKAGVKWVQLRIKDQPESEILAQACEARALCDDYGARLIINDHPRIAERVNADGVHLGLEDMSVAKARAILGPEKIIGSTANTIQHVAQHAAAGADYVGLGPFRFTTTKKKLSPILGLEGYRNILAECRERNISIPVVAIGGIQVIDIPALLGAGVHGVAVSSVIIRNDVKHTVESIQNILNKEENYA